MQPITTHDHASPYAIVNVAMALPKPLSNSKGGIKKKGVPLFGIGGYWWGVDHRGLKEY